MKKLMTLLALFAALTLTLTACGGSDTPAEPEEAPITEEEPAPYPGDAPEAGPEGEIPQGTTVGHTLEDAFLADPSGSPQEIADRLLTNEIIPFVGATMAVEPGLLMGFGETEITGFSEGVMFGPSIGTIPFVGYIFTLDGSVDAETFLQLIRDAADLRWNVCTEADELLVSASGDTVFFLMCPAFFEA